MMHRNTVLVAISSILFFSVSVAVLGYVAYLIHVREGELRLHREEAALGRAHEEALSSITHTVDVSKNDREELRSRAVEEDDVIQILALIESVGKENGLRVETRELTVRPKSDTFETLQISLMAKGKYDDIVRLVELLENLPYSSKLERFAVSRDLKGQTNEWEASILLDVLKFK